ncbi:MULTISPECIES: PAS domain-containing protein [unclassified Xanthobacter]|uniref:PAS domain-containing protein n=1 Tax=unclassified Xanthobacter TaxID=2623496 RepID=UPI001F3A26F6|nr:MULTISPECIES: PAS domain-containing protein [unclassified Xanthobacter]
MMTETKARALDLTEPRLAPLRREDLPSFVVDVSTSAVLGVTAACVRLGIAVGHHLPPKIAEAAQAAAEGRGRPAALVRLRLPRSLTPRLFRAIVLDVSGAPVVMFADPAAFADEPALAVETRPDTAPLAPQPPAPNTTLEPQEPSVRFTFETDAENRLRGLSASLASALGAQAEAWIGATFPELEHDGRIVSGQAMADALARGASFSGVHVTVPGAVILELELGGVPLLDAARRRLATRGFGVMRRWTTGPETTPAAFEVTPDADVRMPVAAKPQERPSERPWSNVVPFSGLTPRESNYFDEIGRTLEAALRADIPAEHPDESPLPAEPAPLSNQHPAGADILDALPIATLLEDRSRLVHANRTFLQWSGWTDLTAIEAAGGLPGVLQEEEAGEGLILTPSGEHLPVHASEVPATFYGPEAQLHLLRRREAEPAAATLDEEASPRRAALDLVPWPVLLIDSSHHIMFANNAAETRLGFSAVELAGQPITLVIAPEARGEAIGWLDRASTSQERSRPRVLHVHPFEGEDFHALAGLAPVGDDTGQFCLVLGPEPQPDTPSGNAPAAEPEPPAALEPEPTAEEPVPESVLELQQELLGTADELEAPSSASIADPSLHRVARRLADSLSPSLATLADYAPDDESDLPDGVRDALERVRKCLDDLGALAEPEAIASPEPTEVAPIVTAAVAYVLPFARRRHVTVRTDIDQVPTVITHPARLSRLVRLMVEDALDGAPVRTAIVVSLLCDELTEGAPVILQVSDAGPPVDEVADAAALAPLSAATDTDRFSRAGRPMRRARLAAEAEALGATFELRRGLEMGMTTQLSLPR